MPKKSLITDTYESIGTIGTSSDSVPIDSDVIGTRISSVSALIGRRTAASKAAGVSLAALQRYISGKNMPPFDAAARLCIAAGVRMEWLATGEGEMMEGEKTAPLSQSHEVRAADVPMDVGLLSMAVRIVDEVLVKYGIRSDVSSEQFAELVRVTFHDLARGAAEDAASESLDRIMAIAKPHRD